MYWFAFNEFISRPRSLLPILPLINNLKTFNKVLPFIYLPSID